MCQWARWPWNCINKHLGGVWLIGIAYISGEYTIKLVQDIYVRYFSFMEDTILVSFHSWTKPKIDNNITLKQLKHSMWFCSILDPAIWRGTLHGSGSETLICGVPAGNHTRKYTLSSLVTVLTARNNTVTWLWSFTSITSSNHSIDVILTKFKMSPTKTTTMRAAMITEVPPKSHEKVSLDANEYIR